MNASIHFVSSAEFAAAWRDLRAKAKKLRLVEARLERQVSMDQPWQFFAAGKKSRLFKIIRGLDRTPLPGRFRLAIEETGHPDRVGPRANQPGHDITAP